MKPTIEYNETSHTVKVDEIVIPISNEAYSSDDLLTKIKVICADMGINLTLIDKGMILSLLSTKVTELITLILAEYNAKKILDKHKTGEKLN